MRLRLRPGLHQVWRRPGRVQIGLDPRLGVVLDGVSAADEAVLSALAAGSTVRGVVRTAVRAGGTEERALTLVEELRAGGVLTDDVPVRSVLARLPADVRHRMAVDVPAVGLAQRDRDPWQVLESRRRRSVAVVGLGRTGLGVALATAAVGVGRLVVEDRGVVSPSDEMPGGYPLDQVGQPRVQAARDVIARTSPATTVLAGQEWHRDRADVVVVVAHGVLDPARVDPLLQDDVPHLPVVWGEGSVCVGPLVVPGRSSCLRCQHLHRTDRDPEWAAVVSQVANRRVVDGPPEESSLSLLAVGLATGQVVAHLDGAGPVTVNAALEVSLPGRGVAVRAWPPHRACGCIRLPPVAGTALTGTMER